MENSKKILALILGLAMVLGVTPAFAEEPYTTGTSNAEIGVKDTVSIVVSGDVLWSDLFANNVLQTAKQTNITSHSNVPINVNVKGSDFSANMPIWALKYKNSTNTEYSNMATTDNQVLTGLAAPVVNGDSSQLVDLNIQVPFGVLTNTYSTTLTWTASKV